MLNNNTVALPPEPIIISNYATKARSLLKSYFLKEKTTSSDVASYSKQAISLIHYIDTVIENNYKITPLQRGRLQEIAEMLTLFESSLVVTTPEEPASITYKVAC